MTVKERNQLINDMVERHGGHTDAFWAEWDRRHENNEDGFRDITKKILQEHPNPKYPLMELIHVNIMLGGKIEYVE